MLLSRKSSLAISFASANLKSLYSLMIITINLFDFLRRLLLVNHKQNKNHTIDGTVIGFINKAKQSWYKTWILSSFSDDAANASNHSPESNAEKILDADQQNIYNKVHGPKSLIDHSLSMVKSRDHEAKTRSHHQSFLDQQISEPTSDSSSQMRDQAYEICKKYLSGEWKNISSDDMIFKTVSGGLSNLLFYCSLPSTHTPVTGEPSQVLLRMYGQLLDKNDTKITDSVITMLLSERNLGPKLYGIFPGGRLEEYIPARAMVCSELKDPNYSAIIARKLAIVHDLNVPINKEPTWLPDTMKNWLKNVRRKTNELEKKVLSPLEQEMIHFDFESEIENLFQILSKCKSPVVFCHNDLQEGNILLPSNEEQLSHLLKSTDSKTSQANWKQFEDHIVFIDFEYCAYNFRGFDLANHFCERMFDYSNPEWPHYYEYKNEFPNDEQKRDFIKEYIKQSKELKNSTDESLDTEDHLIMEADFYALASHLLWTIWSVNNHLTSKISFGYLEYGKTRLEGYKRHMAYLKEKYCLK